MLAALLMLTSPKDLSRVQNDAALGNTPLWFGEWSLATNFNATDAFLKDWADAQKLAYSESAGWIVRIRARGHGSWF